MKPMTTYVCPKCGGRILLRIIPSAPPTCSNHIGRKAAVMVPRSPDGSTPAVAEDVQH